METKDIIFIAVGLLILAEVTVLLSRMPRNTLSRKNRSMLIDTSVLIDGRIVAIAQSGFVTDTFVIPRSVIGELQFLADNADAEKRARARHGLDVVAELQEISHIEVQILQDGSHAKEGVDNRLLSLAKQYSAALCTIDFNLNKVALVEGITVLNINELAQNLRMAHLPGETMLLELVQKGQDSHQAVGYLSDGTMVVVEHANTLIGQTIEVEVIRSLQTAAGKMMFARRRMTAKQPATKSAKPAGRAAAAVEVSSKTSQNHSSKNNHPKAIKKQQVARNHDTATTKRTTNSSPRKQPNKRRQSNEDKLIALVEEAHKR